MSQRTATFEEFRGDYKMLGYFVTGRMGPELDRLYGSRHPAPDAPLLAT
jgi:hypothetical protein